MSTLQRLWNCLLVEPLTWLFYYCFQTARFKREIEQDRLLVRLTSALKLSVPLFLCSFLLTSLLRALLSSSFPMLYDPTSTGFVTIGPYWLQFLGDNAVVVALYMLFGVGFSLIFGLTFGTTVSIALGLASGICLKDTYDQMTGLVYGLALGLLFGLTYVSTKTFVRRNVISIFIGILIGILSGTVTGILGGFWAGYLSGIIGGKALAQSIIGSAAGAVGGGVLGIALTSMLGAIIKEMTRGARDVVRAGNNISLIVSGAFGLVLGIVIGNKGLQVALEQITRAAGFSQSIALGTSVATFLAFAFLLGYFVGYCRLPLYPISALSAARAYLSSRKNPLLVFSYLHRSSLYWDERVFLPLPYLTPLLLIAVNQDTTQAHEEIAFIIAERPLQISAARTASVEMALNYLESCDSLRDIVLVSEQLKDFLPQEALLLDPLWVTPFIHLNDASLDAARYYSPLGWDLRHNALEEMIANLKRVYPNSAFRDTKLNQRLGTVVKTWQMVARRELAVLEQSTDRIGDIRNPYNPGTALKLGDNLFVGRQDLAKQLGQALDKGSNRPTFLLNGERRMGKSSVLNQLSRLLGARYLPIIYDLQYRGATSDTAVFLGTIAKEIHLVANRRGIRIKSLEYERLQAANEKNEAATYHIFNSWLNTLELLLEQEDRVLLLAFDEFEKLEDTGQRKHLDLDLLLDWFRTVIQHSSRIALLFSGVASFADLNSKWANSLVNVQALKVSFLHDAEAYQLITRPTKHFPGDQVFHEEVVAEIMHVTACHPFFIQGVCSALITHLNVEKRFPAELPDVAVATREFFKGWWDTYFRNLWERTDPQQRACLAALRKLGESDLALVGKYSELDEKTVHYTLEILLRRDLVIQEQDCYRIAAPILSEWVERNSR